MSARKAAEIARSRRIAAKRTPHDAAQIVRVEPVCVECGKLGRLTLGEAIYPDRKDLHDRLLYVCDCGAYVGCHEGTDVPLGYPAGPTTRRARSAAHAAFDPLWKKKAAKERVRPGRARRAGYMWLSEQLGIPFARTHIAMFDAATAWRVVELCKPRRKETDDA